MLAESAISCGVIGNGDTVTALYDIVLVFLTLGY